MDDESIVTLCKPFTLTSELRLKQTIDTIDYVVKNGLEGDIVEVGVWRGGNVMAMLFKLLQLGVTDRHIHLYDTFEGMTEPSSEDVNVHGMTAERFLDKFELFRCVVQLDDVKRNVFATGYPRELIHFHVGDVRLVEESDVPERIACLRLDIDWHELYVFCFYMFEPRVVPKGPVTIDDYGYWNGCKKAVDDFVRTRGNIRLVPVDSDAVYWLK